MKDIKIIKYLFLMLVTFLACDDFVEVDPIGANSEEFFNSEDEYEAALIGAYDLLQASFKNNLIAVSASDDYGSGGDPVNYDQPVVQNVNLMIHTPADQGQLREIWQFMYAGLNRVNYLLENKDKTAFAGKPAILAQAYFLRAYYTFELVKFFGNIPLKVEVRNGVKRIADSRISSTEQFEIVRTESIAEVYGLIQEDLKEAVLNLPATQDLPYKATLGAANALLGKAYLYDGKFSEAATALAEVIGKYSLVTGAAYTTLFEKSGENGTESVFEIQYTNVEGAGWDCLQCSEGNYFIQFNGPRDLDDPDFAAGWGFFLPSQALYDTFDATDSRRDVTFLNLIDRQDDYSPAREDTGLYNRKNLPRSVDKEGNASTAELTHGNNYRAIRYADVLLMAAEADAQSGGANAETYLNEVRARAYGNSNNDYDAIEGPILDAIYDERRKELAGEGHRFFDLVRTGKAKAAFEAYNASKPADFEEIIFIENKNEVFPIPLLELELALAVERWGQNQGYN